jgi:hypothetical protein
MSAQMPTKPGSLVQWLPMIALQLYLGTTVLAFAFGPWPWPVFDPVALYGFLLAAHVALLLGYAVAIGAPSSSGMSMPTMRTLLLWSIALNLLVIFPTARARTGQWIPDVGAALIDLGVAYDKSIDLRLTATGPVEYVRVIIGPILYVLLPWMLYYWKSIPVPLRMGGLVWLFVWGAVAVGMGTRKALADIILVAPWMFIAGHYGGFSRWKRSTAIRLMVGGVLVFMVFVNYFANGQLARQGGGAAAGTFGGLDIAADFDHWSVRNFDPLTKIGTTQLILYTTQGYYALGLALEKPWVPTFGVGNSMFLFRNVARAFGMPGIGELPYPVRVTAADGWDHTRLWDTIYPWIASDLSFPGTVLAMFVIGWLLARAWKDALGGRNPLAVPVVALLMVLGFYIPANNQCCQEGESFVSFFVLIIAWLATRRHEKNPAGPVNNEVTIPQTTLTVDHE